MRTSLYTTAAVIALTVASLAAPSLAHAKRFASRAKPMAPASMGKAPAAASAAAPAAAAAPAPAMEPAAGG